MRHAGKLVVEPWMTHERLDDQVMMINLETGAYFALERPAADCWTALTAGAGFDDIVDDVVARFEVARAQAEGDVEAFLHALVEEGLVRPTTDPPVPFPAPTDLDGARLTYRAPQIEKHDDLEELLLLDPIHDIGPEGWPAVT